MKKVIRVVDEKKGIVQVTTADERWYIKPGENPTTGLPVYEYVPSVTWIADHYPKGIGFYKWLADKGWNEAEAIKNAAGDKGSKVHYAIGDLLGGHTVSMQSQYINHSTELPEQLTLEEYEALLSFKLWFTEIKPEIIAAEKTVWCTADNYAGTIDLVCRIEGELWIIDFKTSQYIWPSHELQLSAYKHSDHPWQDAKLGILQLGYRRNKKQFKFTEISNQYELFLAAKQIWAKESAAQTPHQRDYPLSIALGIKPLQSDEATTTTKEKK
jgi:hypothetical protein